MKTTTLLDRCRTSQLEALLGLAVEPDASPISLPPEAGDTRELQRLLNELLPDQRESVGLLLEALLPVDQKLEVLERLKELGKRLVADAPTESHRNAARVLYHAAIAAACAHHGVNLSSHPIRSRLSLYEELAALLGTHPLGAVFRKAVTRAARDRMEPKQRELVRLEDGGE